jgi:hypothetical protein
MIASCVVISFGLPLAAYWIVQVRRLLQEIPGDGSPTSNRPYRPLLRLCFSLAGAISA